MTPEEKQSRRETLLAEWALANKRYRVAETQRSAALTRVCHPNTSIASADAMIKEAVAAAERMADAERDTEFLRLELEKLRLTLPL